VTYQPTYQPKTWEKLLPYIIIIVIVVSVIAVVGVLVTTSSPATVTAINVASDIEGVDLRILNGTNRVNNVDWGTLQENNTYTRTFTVACDSTAQVTAEASAWNPRNATTYLTFNYTCTYAGIVTPYSDVNITFQLTVKPAAPGGNFTFTVTVTATETPNRFIQAYGEWQIYKANGAYVAVHSDMKRVITDTELTSLKTEIDEVAP